MPASAAAAPSTWGRVSSTVTLVTAVLAAMLAAFALPQLHLHLHKIPIAGPAPATKVIGAQLEAGQPGSFDVTAVPNAGAARARILEHEDYGAIVAGTSGLSVFTASAASPAVAQLMKNLASALQPTRHTPVPVDDITAPRSSRCHRLPEEKIRRKNRNTLSTSRKIEAAIKGAELMSFERRSRWKSTMVKPAKITRPITE